MTAHNDTTELKNALRDYMSARKAYVAGGQSDKDHTKQRDIYMLALDTAVKAIEADVSAAVWLCADLLDRT